MFNLGLIGKARSGKDSAAAHLVASRRYTRLAFADALKAMALEIDPMIDAFDTGCGAEIEHLAEVVSEQGWEFAKDTYPEVRRFLQRLGASLRERDPDYWLNIVRRQITSGLALNMTMVVTDVRYANEAEALRREGFRLIRIVRPEGPALSNAWSPSIRRMADDAKRHASETELDSFEADVTVVNDTTLAELYERILIASR